MKKRIALILMTICILLGVTRPAEAEAALNITRAEFLEMIVKELELKVDGSADQPYIDAALREGIISKSTFADKYNDAMTRSDAAVVLVRADEYLNGITVSDDTVQMVIEKRISDISKVSKARQPFVAKCYYLGYIVGTSNGIYSKDRKFNPSGKFTKKTAELLVSRIKDQEKRELISPDGQKIRTTNLPELAEFYPYILETFPNEYYDWEFHFMQSTNSNGKPIYGTDEWVSLVDYAAPVDFLKIGNGEKIWYNYSSNEKLSVQEVYDMAVDKWEANAEQYLNLVFNVDYRTLKEDSDWYQGVKETHWLYGDKEDVFKTNFKKLEDYIEAAIENKTIVESQYIGVDRSSIYECYGSIFIRAHVRYRIISSESLERVYLSPIIFTNYWHPNLLNVKLGEWRDAYFTIEVTDEYENCGIREAVINDYYHDIGVVKK